MRTAEHPTDCTLWTPWGPQLTEAETPRVAALKRTLRGLKAGKFDAVREQDEVRDNKPECAYDP